MPRKKRKICVVTGSRAEYGLLYWVMRDMKDDPEIELQLAVTGTHLSAAHGGTVQIIEQDNFTVNKRVELDLSHDNDIDIACAVGTGVGGFAEAFEELRPELILVLGDRYEIFAAVTAAMFLKVPVAHIAGGDVTEGAYDDAMRHSITKMSHIHFVTSEEAGRRVRQLGEDPDHVHVVGSPGLDHLRRATLLSKGEVEARLGLDLSGTSLLITFHPATLDETSPGEQFLELLKALEELPDEWTLIFTRPNADAGGHEIDALIDPFVASRPNAGVFTSLGQQLYLSTMALVSAVVGNSSSGLYEAPSFKKATVNIGDRQEGRLKAASVIDRPPERTAILAAIRSAVEMDCSKAVNPYGDGRSSARIIKVLKEIEAPQTLLKKRFHDLALKEEK